MKSHEDSYGYSGNWRRKTAAVVAGGLAVFMGMSELSKASAERARSRDPILMRTDKMMDKVGAEMKLMLKEGVTDVYKEKVPAIKKGEKSQYWRIVASTPSFSMQTGSKRYTQLVSIFKNGHKNPDSVAMFIGTPSPRYGYGEPYEQMQIMLRGYDTDGNMIIQDAHLNVATNKTENEYFWSKGSHFVHQLDSGAQVMVDRPTVAEEFDTFNKEIDVTAHFMMGGEKKKPIA